MGEGSIRRAGRYKLVLRWLGESADELCEIYEDGKALRHE
jgi:hypothetical protein